jgi:hypothetical protein
MNSGSPTDVTMDVEPNQPTHADLLAEARADITKIIQKQATAMNSVRELNKQLENPATPAEEKTLSQQLIGQWRERLATLKSDLKNCQDYREGIEIEMARATKEAKQQQQSEENATKEKQGEQQASNGRFQSLLKLTPSTLQLKDLSLAEEFIKDFVQFLENHVPTESERKTFVIPLLQYLIREVQGHAVFVKKLKDPKNEYWDLVQLKTLFLDHYAGQSWHASQCAQLANIAMGYEKPGDYIGRITQQTSQLGIKLDEQLDAGMGRIVKGWFYQLPHNVQQSLSGEMGTILETGTIQDYLDCVQKHVPQKPGRVEGCPLYCPYCPKKVTYSCSCETMNRMGRKGNNGTKRISDSNFTAREPKTDGQKVSSGFKKPRRDSVVVDNLKAEGKCFKCQEPNWTPKHRCRGVNAVVTLPEVPEVLGEWDRDLDLEDPLCVSTALGPMSNAYSEMTS